MERAARLDCDRWLTINALLSGNPRLNLAFLAALFNAHPGLTLTDDAKSIQRAAQEASLLKEDDTREARVLINWINSLQHTPRSKSINLRNVIVRDLGRDLRDGLVLLRLLDALSSNALSSNVKDAVVDWSRVNADPLPLSRFKSLENTNYAVEVARKDPFRLSLIGIQGADLTDGSLKLTLGFMWQLMRMHLLQMIGQGTTEDDVLAWIRLCNPANSKLHSVKSFKDSSFIGNSGIQILRNCLIRIGAISPNDEDNPADLLSTSGEIDQVHDSIKYLLNVAWRSGAVLFCLPEDIVDGRPRMLLSLYASLMALARSKHIPDNNNDKVNDEEIESVKNETVNNNHNDCEEVRA